MKLHSFIREILTFSFIFLFFLLPPVFVSFSINNNNVIQWNLPVSNIIYGLFSLALYLEYKQKTEIKTKFLFFYKEFSSFIFTFGFLFTTSLIFKFIASFYSVTNSTQINFPQTFLSWLYCITSFLFSAYFEEVIYRFYTPEILKYFLNKIKSEKFIYILSEGFPLVLFSISHYYLGFLSVFNAMIAHIILRICFNKSESIFPGFLAHFIYNIISLILL